MEVLEKKPQQIYSFPEYAKHLSELLTPYILWSSKVEDWPKEWIISRGTYYKLKNGIFPTKDTIYKVCNFLKVDPPKIFF